MKTLGVAGFLVKLKRLLGSSTLRVPGGQNAHGYPTLSRSKTLGISSQKQKTSQLRFHAEIVESGLRSGVLAREF